MRNILFKTITSIGFVLVVLLLFAFNAALIWVATGPRDISSALPYIEEALDELNEAHRVDVRTGVLVWDGWRNPVDIRLYQVDVYTKNGTRFATFPEVSVGLNLFSLLLAKVEPNSLVIRHPIISLYQSEDGAISFGLPADNLANPEVEVVETEFLNPELGKTIYQFFSDGYNAHYAQLNRLEVVDASVSIGNRRHGVLMEAEQVKFRFERNQSAPVLWLQAYIRQAGKEAALAIVDIEPDIEKEKLLARFRVQSLWPETLAPMGGYDDYVEAAQFPLSGWLQASLISNGEIGDYSYLLKAARGKIHSDLLQETLNIESMQLKGSGKGSYYYKVDSAEIDFGVYRMQARGFVKKTSSGFGVRGKAGISKVPTKDVARFWPPALAPISREWVLENISHGTVASAQMRVNIAPGDLQKERLPVEAVKAEINVKGAHVRYLPNHPPITNIDSHVSVNAKELQVKVEKGSYGSGTRFSNAMVSIDDLEADNPRIEVSFDADGAAADVADFLSRKPAELASRLNLSASSFKGRGKGKVSLGFNYFTPRLPDGSLPDDMGVDYVIDAELANIKAPQFLHRYDIANAKGTLHVDNDTVRFKGSGDVQGANVTTDLAYYSQAQNGVELDMKLDASGDVSVLPVVGLAELPYVTGALSGKGWVKQYANSDKAEFTVDLSRAEIAIDVAKYVKPVGDPATLKLAVHNEAGVTRIPEFHYKAGEDSAQGSIALKTDGGELLEANLTGLVFADNDIALSYRSDADGDRYVVKGRRLDVSGWMEKQNEEEGFSFQHFPSLSLNINLEEFIYREGYPVKKLAGVLNCLKAICNDAALTGSIQDKQFSFSIRPDAQGRQFRLAAEDAGVFLKGMDVYDDMSGGTLRIDGVFHDAEVSRPLKAKLEITEHSIEKTPALAKLLTLASLSGLVDTLQGKGISFKKFTAPFELKEDVVTLKEAKTFGSAIGMTFDGTISFPSKKLDIEGVVVPSYALNTVFGNIPLLGNVITGGGEGIFAARYTMQGDSDDPSISVNPLSMLTPGFLRGIFDIFDAPEKNESEVKKEGNASELPASNDDNNTLPTPPAVVEEVPVLATP